MIRIIGTKPIIKALKMGEVTKCIEYKKSKKRIFQRQEKKNSDNTKRKGGKRRGTMKKEEIKGERNKERREGRSKDFRLMELEVI